MCDQKGAPCDLLGELNELAPRIGVSAHAKGWPKAANVLTRRLNVVRSNLSAAGIRVTDDRSAQKRQITIREEARENTAGEMANDFAVGE